MTRYNMIDIVHYTTVLRMTSNSSLLNHFPIPSYLPPTSVRVIAH